MTIKTCPCEEYRLRIAELEAEVEQLRQLCGDALGYINRGGNGLGWHTDCPCVTCSIRNRLLDASKPDGRDE